MSETAELQDPKPEEANEVAPAAETPAPGKEGEAPAPEPADASTDSAETSAEAQVAAAEEAMGDVAETVAPDEDPAEPGTGGPTEDTWDEQPDEPGETPVQTGSVEAIEEQFGIESKPEESDTEDGRLRAILEAVIYVTDEPLSAKQIADALGQTVEKVEKGLAQLAEACSQSDRGLSIREIAGGYKMSTKPEFHEEIRTFVKKLKPPLKLSLAALETLAVIAYKQPITGPEIMEIRGVQGGGVLKTLLDRKLITTSGRKQVVGRPVLYKTTKDFLVQFGLKDLAELPTLKEFEEWSRLALGADEPEMAEPVPAAWPATAEPGAEPQAAAAEAASSEPATSEPSTSEPADEATAAAAGPETAPAETTPAETAPPPEIAEAAAAAEEPQS